MREPSFFPDLAALKRGIEQIEEASRVKFIVLNKDKAFGKEFNFAEKTSFRLRWEYDDELHPCRIPFTGVPFISVGRKTMECHMGKDRNIRQKEKYAIQTDMQRDPNSKKKSQALLRTKKVSCPASVIIIQLARLPDIKVKENKEWTKRVAAAEFRKMLSKGHIPQQKSEFYALLPKDEDHKGHPIKNEAAGQREPTIPEVVEKVRALTCEGVTKVSDMKQRIVNFLHKELQVTDTLRRRYMPTNSDISNIMQSVRKKTAQDPDHMEEFVAMMKKKRPGDLLFYRGCSSKQKLLFCYQSTWQSRLLNRYGNTFCLLDAPHRVSGCSKKLFVLFVRTNISYVAVGAFIVEEEEEEQIQGALDIFAKWNPNWAPKNILVDVAVPDIKASEACFKDCSVILSDSHRERTWSAFVTKNCEQKKDRILAQLRQIAHAESEERYQESLSRLLNSPDVKRNESFHSLLTNTWVPQAKRWVRCFQDERLYMAVHAGGGVEKQTEALKYQAMEDYTNSSLRDLVSRLIRDFFPESYRKYLEHNARSSSGYNQYNATIPAFLQNRPRHIVRHIQDRMQCKVPKESIQCQGNGTFLISQCEDTIRVCFGSENRVPSCTCRDWRTHLLPCKHFCAIFCHFPEWQWDNLSPPYRDNPIFTLDETFQLPNCGHLQRGVQGGGDRMDIVAMETDLMNDCGEQRRQALQEYADAVRTLTASVKRLRDASQILEVNRTLQRVMGDLQPLISGNAATVAERNSAEKSHEVNSVPTVVENESHKGNMLQQVLVDSVQMHLSGNGTIT